MSEIVRTARGTLPVQGTRVPRRQDEAITPGAVYELHGEISSWVMWAAPDAWIENWLGRARAIKDPSGTDRFQVLGAMLNPDGRFFIQVRANHGSPLVLIAAGVIAVLSLISAGVVINQIFEILPDVAAPIGDGIEKGVTGLVLIGGLVFAGAMLWKSQ